MKKINFRSDVLPHVVAVAIFLIVTLFFFAPVFFEHKAISQHDIEEGSGLAKSLADYRNASGEEGLWAESAFSGMPAYLISVRWSNQPVLVLEQIFTLFLPHPVSRIFAAFLCFYCMLLAFGVRPSLSIAGALAFGLSSFMIIGMAAGHNSRISAIAYMPLIMAGIHLAFNGKRLWGLAVTTLALTFHLRSNHLQITYYFLLILAGYGIVNLVIAIREKRVPEFFKTAAVLLIAVVIAIGTFAGQLWSIAEYTKYSFRGASELQKPGAPPAKAGLTKDYAFQYNYGFWEPMTLLVPEFYGGSSTRAFGQDEKSESYKALVQAAQSGNEKIANQLINHTAQYWGPQGGTLGPYYGGAVILFLFVLGIVMADRKYVYWLVPLFILSWMLSIGEDLKWFNYWMFDHFPGYNKFRSFSFAMVILFFAMPLLGFLGLEKLLRIGINKDTKRQLLIAFGITGGLSLALILFAGMGSYVRDGEGQLPVWFLTALADDRKGLLQADALRSLIFISIVFAALYFDLINRISPIGFFALIIGIVLIDLGVVDHRYFTKNNFKRKVTETFAANEADALIMRDNTSYRVFDVTGQSGPMADARPSYFHQSLGGYHGAKLHRYQDFYDSAILPDMMKLDGGLRTGHPDFSAYKAFNMLNTKYIVLSPEARGVIRNPAAYGNAWFVKEVASVTSPTEELKKVTEVDPKVTAVIDATKFKVGEPAFDSASTVKLIEQKPPYLKYESQSNAFGVIVFSEIYYPEGWHATIDGTEATILRADYILRALEVPAGKQTIEFKFEPKPYVVGNKIVMFSSWLVVLLVMGSLVREMRKRY